MCLVLELNFRGIILAYNPCRLIRMEEGMRFLLVFLGILVLLLVGCAKANNPADTSVMEFVQAFPMVGNALEIDVTPSKIYVAEDLAGFAIIDRDSSYVQWYTEVAGNEGSTELLYKIKNISAVESENRIFVNETILADQIQIIDTTNPDSLIIKSTILGGTSGITDLKFWATNDTTNQFSIVGAFVNGTVYNFGGYLRPSLGDTWLGFTQTIILPSYAGGFALTDQNIYIAAKQRGLLIYNRSNSTLISELDLPGEANKIVVQGNYAYVACRQEGLQVVDISDVAHPRLVYSYDTTGYAYSVSVNSHYALVGSGGGGAYLFDISNPEKISLLENVTSAGYVNYVVIDGNEAILATRDQGILIYRLP
jgi:hypothetical protein